MMKFKYVLSVGDALLAILCIPNLTFMISLIIL